MPQYEPLPKLKGQPFTLLIAEPLGEPEATLGQFVADFPVEPGIAQIIYPHTIESPSLPGLTVVAREPGEPLGPWLSQALVKSDSARVLIVAGLLPTAETVKAMAEKLDLAHLVLAPRPQKPFGVLGLGLHGVWGFFCRFALALGPAAEPRWPGMGGWCRRFAAHWVFGVPGNDPETPVRMLRGEMVQALNLQSAGGFAWVEMGAKCTFLGALIEELPTPKTSSGQNLPALSGPNWWRDFRALASNPSFGKPWNPHSRLVEGDLAEVPKSAQAAL